MNANNITPKQLRKLAAIADELGAVRADIADLTETETALKQQLADSGLDVIEGDLFRQAIVRSFPKRTTWKAVATKAKASRQLIAANTTTATEPVISVRTAARKGEAA